MSMFGVSYMLFWKWDSLDDVCTLDETSRGRSLLNETQWPFLKRKAASFGGRICRLHTPLPLDCGWIFFYIWEVFLDFVKNGDIEEALDVLDFFFCYLSGVSFGKWCCVFFLNRCENSIEMMYKKLHTLLCVHCTGYKECFCSGARNVHPIEIGFAKD